MSKSLFPLNIFFLKNKSNKLYPANNKEKKKFIQSIPTAKTLYSPGIYERHLNKYGTVKCHNPTAVLKVNPIIYKVPINTYYYNLLLLSSELLPEHSKSRNVGRINTFRLNQRQRLQIRPRLGIFQIHRKNGLPDSRRLEMKKLGFMARRLPGSVTAIRRPNKSYRLLDFCTIL